MGMEEKKEYLTHLIVYAFFQGIHLLSGVWIFVVAMTTYNECKTLLDPVPYVEPVNKTNSSSGIQGPIIFCEAGGNMNFSASVIAPEVDHMNVLQYGILAILGWGTLIYVVHMLTLLPNILKHYFDPDFVNNIDFQPAYYRMVFKIHMSFLIFESLVHDIPAGCIAIEFACRVWEPINCWECKKTLAEVPGDVSHDISTDWVTAAVFTLVAVSMYKGILPIFRWMGNPFCFDCYGLRICVFIPVGILYLIFVFTPVAGVLKYRFYPIAPSVKGYGVDMTETLWTFGLMAWGVTLAVVGIGGFFYWFCCKREAKDGDGGCLCC